MESARLEELRAKLGHPIESEILFSEAFLKWLELYKSPPARKPSTYASYLDTYRIHFAEAFGNLPLYQITQDVVQDYRSRIGTNQRASRFRSLCRFSNSSPLMMSRRICPRCSRRGNISAAPPA